MHSIDAIEYFSCRRQPRHYSISAEVVRQTPVSQAPNGICYAVSGEVTVSLRPGADGGSRAECRGALERKAYYFVPLTVNQGDETVIADRYDVALSDNAVCHRNLNLGDSQCVFISTRLMDDKFSVAFEFYINVGHAMVERAGSLAGICRTGVEAGGGRRSRRDFARCLGVAQAGDRDRAGCGEVSRTNISRRRFRRDFDLPAVVCISTWIITICGSGIIRCWRRGRWQSGCGKLRSCFRRIRI